MAVGPFLGAAILGGFDVAGGLARLGVAEGTPLFDALTPTWRWVFYVNVPIGLIAVFVAWAASGGWETPRRRVGIDVFGAAVWSVALAAALGATTLIGVADLGGPDPVLVGLALAGVAVVGTLLTIVRGFRRPDPFLDPRLQLEVLEQRALADLQRAVLDLEDHAPRPLGRLEGEPERLAIAKSLGLVPLDAGAEDVARKLKRAHGAFHPAIAPLVGY
jgi:hypothetical protein